MMFIVPLNNWNIARQYYPKANCSKNDSAMSIVTNKVLELNIPQHKSWCHKQIGSKG